MESAGESPDDRTQNAVARTSAVKAMAKLLWPPLTAPKLIHRLLSDPAFLATSAVGILTDAEQALLLWAKPSKSPASAAWSLPDVVLIDEAGDALNRIGSVGHVIVDEAQDLSAMMLRALGRRASTGSVTLLGDIAQATTPWATGSWQAALGHLGQPQAHIEELVEGFRVPPDVIEFAAQLLPTIAPGLQPPRSVRHQRGNMQFLPREGVVDAVRALAAQEGTVGVIVADPQLAALTEELRARGLPCAVLGSGEPSEGHLDIVPSSLAKGLEFDHVCVVNPVDIVAAEPDEITGLRRLYVVITRAVTSLKICGELPPELPTPEPRSC